METSKLWCSGVFSSVPIWNDDFLSVSHSFQNVLTLRMREDAGTVHVVSGGVA